MLHLKNRTALAWLSLWAPLGVIGAGCSSPLLDVESDDLFTEPTVAGSGGAPDAMGGGGTFPSVPLPPAAGGSYGTGGTGPDTPVPDAGAIEPDAGVVTPNPGAVEGALYAITSAGRLTLLDTASGALQSAADIAGLPDTESIAGADFRPADRQLYALARSGNLYRIDVATAVATPLAALAADPADTTAPFSALDGTRFGIDFNPVVDRLRVVSETGQNLRINVDTGRAFTDAVLNPGSPNVTASAYGSAFAAACRTRLYGIDASSQALLLQDPPNDGKLNVIGNLGIAGAVTGVAGFDVWSLADGSERAVAVAEVDGASALFDVNLATGLASAARPIALEPGEVVLAASFAPAVSAPVQAPGELIAMTESGRVVSFNRGAPAKLCTAAAVTGLGPSEVLLGLDVRPADGAVYALGDAGNVYTLDVRSGAAALRSALSADPTDTTNPYAGLSDADYGIGFNPVPDRLRVIGSAGQNLRINVDTGATFTDAAIGAPSSVGALAYANAFAGAKSTTLFAVDAEADTLVRVGADPATAGACPGDAGNPNCGILSSIGALGRDVSSIGGFDIDGKSGGSAAALLAVNLDRTDASTLFTVDLETGALSAPPGVANATIGGGERVVGLTLARDPVLNAFVVTADAQLIRFSPRTPAVFDQVVAITNLYEGETLAGVDIRPADGALYAVGKSGRLYTLDTLTGAATLVAALEPAAGDDNPFFGLDTRASHGVDVNPAADLLRVVSDWGQNLRVVPSTRSLGTPAVLQVAGATFTDLDLGPDFPTLVASAYTNSFSGAVRTTLFGIDAASDQLVRQGGPDGSPSPNTGALTALGALGVDALGDIAFDIGGGRNGLALAVIETAAEPPSVYSVSLTTGAATPFNVSANVVGDGSLDIVGVALRIR